MAVLSPQFSKAGGTSLAFAAADAGGDQFEPSARNRLVVVNDDAGSITVTVVTPGNDKYGNARPDIDFSIPAGESAVFGPFPQDLADPADGLVDVSYSGVTNVTVALIA